MSYRLPWITPGKPSGTKYSLAILALSLLASMPTRAQESTVQKNVESMQAALQPTKLYTEEEALMAAMAAAERAVSVAVPLAVQAAVAEERGKAAAQHVLDGAVTETFRRQSRNWRSATLMVTALSLAALVWWVKEDWPLRKNASLAP
jgi:hypothetical protein